jgi:hypothetical protein
MRLSFFLHEEAAPSRLVMVGLPLVQCVTDFAYASARLCCRTAQPSSPAIASIGRQRRLAEGEQGASWAINMDAAG